MRKEPKSLNHDTGEQARLGLTLFFILLILLSVPAYWLRIKGNYPFVILFPPAIASILARLILKEGFGDVSFRLRGHNLGRAYLTAYLFPMILALTAYGVTWAGGLTEFDFSSIQANSRLPLPDDPVAGFALWLLLSWTVVTAVYMIFVAGEEIGWRGYMLTRLIDSGVPNPLLVHGLIWSAYHIPLIIAGAYSAASGPWVFLSVVMFTVVATSFSYLLAWLRLDTGSIWPPFVAHATFNALTQGAFNPVTKGENSMLWVGESGIVVAVVLVLMVFLLRRNYSHLKYVHR